MSLPALSAGRSPDGKPSLRRHAMNCRSVTGCAVRLPPNRRTGQDSRQSDGGAYLQGGILTTGGLGDLLSQATGMDFVGGGFVKCKLIVDPARAGVLCIDLQEEHRKDSRYLVEGFEAILQRVRRIQQVARALGIPVYH